MNSWRILCLAIQLAKRNGLRLTVADLILMYQVSKNPSHGRYYLAMQPWFDHLVRWLYDTEKWANVFVKVFDNFEWGPVYPQLDYLHPTRSGLAILRPWPIPRVRGNPGR